MGGKRIPPEQRPAWLQLRKEQKKELHRKNRANPDYHAAELARRRAQNRKYPDLSPLTAMKFGGSLGGQAGSREDKSRAGKLGAAGLAKNLGKARSLFGGMGSPAPPRPSALRVPKPPKPPRSGPVRGPDITLGPGDSYEIRPFRRQRFER